MFGIDSRAKTVVRRFDTSAHTYTHIHTDKALNKYKHFSFRRRICFVIILKWSVCERTFAREEHERARYSSIIWMVVVMVCGFNNCHFSFWNEYLLHKEDMMTHSDICHHFGMCLNEVFSACCYFFRQIFFICFRFALSSSTAIIIIIYTNSTLLLPLVFNYLVIMWPNSRPKLFTHVSKMHSAFALNSQQRKKSPM